MKITCYLDSSKKEIEGQRERIITSDGVVLEHPMVSEGDHKPAVHMT